MKEIDFIRASALLDIVHKSVGASGKLMSLSGAAMAELLEMNEVAKENAKERAAEEAEAAEEERAAKAASAKEAEREANQQAASTTRQPRSIPANNTEPTRRV